MVEMRPGKFLCSFSWGGWYTRMPSRGACLLATKYYTYAGVWEIVGSRILRACRRGMLTPRSTVEGGDESVKDRARGQVQAIPDGSAEPLAVDGASRNRAPAPHRREVGAANVGRVAVHWRGACGGLSVAVRVAPFGARGRGAPDPHHRCDGQHQRPDDDPSDGAAGQARTAVATVAAARRSIDGVVDAHRRRRSGRQGGLLVDASAIADVARCVVAGRRPVAR